MKNQYFGDFNDYVKYGLLRCFSAAGLRIGVCWMLTPDDGRGHGGKIRYLSEGERWRAHDPPLFDILNSSVGAGRPRHISIAEKGSIIPRASFFPDIVPDSRAERSAWLRRALLALSSAELLFLDPDNGLEIPSVALGAKNSSKYLYWSEVGLAWERGASLLIFQHFARENRDTHTERLVRRLQMEAPEAMVSAIRTPNVLFLLASQPAHRSRSKAALDTARVKWQGAITL